MGTLCVTGTLCWEIEKKKKKKPTSVKNTRVITSNTTKDSILIPRESEFGEIASEFATIIVSSPGIRSETRSQLGPIERERREVSISNYE